MSAASSNTKALLKSRCTSRACAFFSDLKSRVASLLQIHKAVCVFCQSEVDSALECITDQKLPLVEYMDAVGKDFSMELFVIFAQARLLVLTQ